MSADGTGNSQEVTDARAIEKMLRRSGFVKLPLPSAMLAAMESDARFSWSLRKPYPRGKLSVKTQIWSAKSRDF